MNKFFFFYICLFCSFLVSARNNTVIEHYSTGDGLPHVNVNCALKSSDGFLWFGTWYGLCSFDGAEFRTYNTSSNSQIDTPPRKIQDILEDKFGNLWIKTIDHKLYIFDKENERFYSYFNQLPKNYSINAQIIKVTKTEEGSFLLLTKNKDLLIAFPTECGQPEFSILYNSNNKTASSRLENNILHEDGGYVNWIGMDYSIISFKKEYELKNKAPNYISTELSKLSNSSYTSAYKGNSNLWLGDQNGSVIRVNLTDGKIKTYNELRGLGEIQNLILINDSLLSASIKNKGSFLLNLTSGEFNKIFSSYSLSIIDSFRDSSGLYWFVTDNNKAVLYNHIKNTAETFKFNIAWSINENISWQDGGELGMFFLTESGFIYHFDREKMNMNILDVSNNYDLSKNKVVFSDLLLDKDGVLWLTSYDNGIFKVYFPTQQFFLFDVTSLNKKDEPSNLNVEGVKALFQEKNGDIWIGSRSSNVAHLSKNGELKQIFSSKNFIIGSVYHIIQDKQEDLWFSTKGQGLVHAVHDERSSSGFKFTRYVNDPNISSSISNNNVYDCFQDSRGRIWVGTFGGGLNLLVEEQGQLSFKHKYNSFNKYPEFGRYMEVRDIIEDEDGRIWVGTSDGLMTFDGSFSSPDSIIFETYDKEFGIFGKDIYNLYKDKNGSIWLSLFGSGLNKLIEYDKKTNRPLFESFDAKNGLNSDVILSIIEDDGNYLWLSTEVGISRFDLKTKAFRNFDQNDGLWFTDFEEKSALKSHDGLIWFGSKKGVLYFDPHKILTKSINYPTYIVDIKVSNQNYNEWTKDSVSVKYLKEITLQHNQSMFSIEFAALNFHAQNQVQYNYILEGYEKEWHFNGRNRIASYTNVPAGKYNFRVQTIDQANPSLYSEKTLQIRILPPWWKSNWAYFIYCIVLMFFLYAIFRVVNLIIKMKNDVYIEQKLSKMKIKFFTNISHELRTPLTLIKSPINEIRENEILSDKGKQYMYLMEKNTNHMLDLVNQILDFRKIENKKMRLHLSPVNLNEVIKSFYDEFYLLSVEKEISYDYHLLNEKLIIWADQKKLETVIRNVISNAFKFTSNGGDVFITAGVDEYNKQCFIRVEDNGIGISENKIADVFQRFSQSNPIYRGTGIGLALSKELINLHNGDIKIESVVNKGSAFIIQLPLGKEHFEGSNIEFYISDVIEETPKDETDDLITIKTEDVLTKEKSDLPVLLIVEDNRELCNLLQMQLGDKYNIHIAHNGEEGLKKIHLHHPDIVVTDQMMPNMSGIEMLKEIRDDFQISHIPVIILTAKNDDDAKIESIQLGANAYITKPFNKKYLTARIDQLLIEKEKFKEALLNKNEEPNQTPDNYREYLMEKDIKFLEDTYQIIEENLDNSDFNIDTIAVGLNLSRSAFFKKLKSITGLAPVDFVKEVRLAKAVELIKNIDLSVSEIAYAVGFKDSGYFGKCFKKKYKLSPREYMNKYKKKL